MKNKITVIGSINMDLVTQTAAVPRMGETILGQSFFTIPGGKGANQAVAAARLGADVAMLGLVGDDAFGQQYISHLRNHHINVMNVKPVTHEKTGVATIILSRSDNSIIVVPGANNRLTPDVIEQNEDVIADSDLVLLQLEIPMVSVVKAAELAKKHSVKVILNPAPFQTLSEDLIDNSDYITPNEHEAEQIFKEVGDSGKLKDKLIITRGARGVAYFQNNQECHMDSFKVDVKDTTGAGDTFNGAFAVAILEGKSVKEACVIATAAAALSVTKLGAQSGMPSRSEVDAFLIERKGRLEEIRNLE